MTKFDINDIIQKLKREVEKNGKTKIKLEVSVELIDKMLTLHCEHDNEYAHFNNKKMKEMNVNLLESANYLILLFYRTEQEYSCTRTKIGKLLSIVAFSYARENKRLFKESIYKYDDCGCAIKKIMTTFDRDIYARCQYNDDNKYISCVLKDISSLDSAIQEKYKEITNVDFAVRQRIEEVFRVFGSYSPTQLGECINPLVKQTGVINNDGEIDLKKISELSYDEIQTNESSPKVLINYLFN